MKWHEIALGDAIHVKHGFAFKSQYFSDSGKFVVLTPGNFNEEGGFRLRPAKDRFYTGDIPEDYVLDEGDLIVAMTEQGPGLLGSSALIPEGGKYLHNQRLGLIQGIDNKALDKRFLYYLFNTRPVRGQISGSATGTKVRHTAPERIYRVKVTVPTDINQQTRIASILSAYDDLIENNRRRIQLLEQAARILYKEWFVRLWFPGHEHVKIKDGVPEGWERRTFGEVAENFDRLRVPLSILERENRAGPYPYHGAAGILGYVDGFLFEGRFLLIGEDGTVYTPSGSAMLQFVEGKFWVSNHAHVVQGSSITTEFLYCFMSHYPIQPHITGVAQPKLSQRNLNRIEILTPSTQLQSLFQRMVSPLLQQVFTMKSQISTLMQTRDLLLPRLMNGEAAV